MSSERWHELMWEQSELTTEEIVQGWHFCWEFDGLLVGPDMTEQEFCTCMEEAP